MHMQPRITGLILLAGLIAVPGAVDAAESYDNCAGFIDTVPATITTQGVWCLRKDLSTAITSGNAITIATNNVTIDCNDFKLGGLQAGAGTNANGIFASGRLNATVRHCNIRGFLRGVQMTGGSGGGHLVEDNRFDGNTYIGLFVQGDGSLVQRNRLNTTGGSTTQTGLAVGLYAQNGVDILDNSVDGVSPIGDGSGNGAAYGIYTFVNTSGSLIGNRVRGLAPLGTDPGYGIYNDSAGRISLRRNDVVGPGTVGLRCSNSRGRAKDNIVGGFTTGLQFCGDAGGNDITP